jgi:hypothetical protein
MFAICLLDVCDFVANRPDVCDFLAGVSHDFRDMENDFPEIARDGPFSRNCACAAPGIHRDSTWIAPFFPIGAIPGQRK